MTVELKALQLFLASRRSIRRFNADPVADELVEALLQAATAAPSAHNRQPWRFVVVRPGEARQRLVQAMGDRLRADLETDGVPADEIDRRLAVSRERLLGAPTAIVLCLSMSEMDRYPDEHRQDCERTMAIQSAALAGGHLLLAAHAAGLGACWLCAPLFAADAVREVLDLPPDWEAQAMIILGRPAEGGIDRGRKPLAEVTLWR